MLRSVVMLLAMALACSGLSAGVLTLHEKQTSPGDLRITGAFAGVEPGATRYLRHAELAASPLARIITDPPLEGQKPRALTVIDVRELIRELRYQGDADTLLARCQDGWETSFADAAWLDAYEPYLVLRIDGHDPEAWPFTESQKAHMGAYYIHISPARHPHYYTDRLFTGKNPSGVVELRAVNYASYYAPYYTGPFARLDGPAARGREYFLNNCAACHSGPGEVGGKKSTRPWLVLGALVTANPDYVRAFLAEPKKFLPGVSMTAFPNVAADPALSDALFKFLQLGFPAVPPAPPSDPKPAP